MERDKIKTARMLAGLATLAAIPLLIRAIRRPAAIRTIVEPATRFEEHTAMQVPELPVEGPIAVQRESEPGGSLVVIGLVSALVGAVLLVGAFAFPPAFVAGAYVFGPVSLLGLATLFVHFRSRQDTDGSAKSGN